MEVTVLGCHAPFPPAGGACNGYLLRSGETAVLVDGGPGVAARLMEFGGVDRLSAIVVSHLHEDHIADLHCLQHAVFGSMRAGRRTEPLPVYSPSEPAPRYGWLKPVAAGMYDLRDLPTQAGLRIGNLTFTFAPTVHPLPCWAMRVTDGRGTWFYSADTSPAGEAALGPLMAGADLAFLEASSTEDQGALYRGWGHLTAADATGMAKRAGVRQALLTHLHPEVDQTRLLAEARAVWGAVDLVEERRTYRIGE